MQPLIWLGILALLLVVEAITAGLTTIWFAGGALVAALLVAGGNCCTVFCFWCFSGTSDLYQTTGGRYMNKGQRPMQTV